MKKGLDVTVWYKKKIHKSRVKALTYAAEVAFFICKWTYVNNRSERQLFFILQYNNITALWIETLTNWRKVFVWRKRARNWKIRTEMKGGKSHFLF